MRINLHHGLARLAITPALGTLRAMLRRLRLRPLQRPLPPTRHDRRPRVSNAKP